MEEEKGKRQKKGPEQEEEVVDKHPEEEYEVEEIRGKRSSKKTGIEYEIKWKNYA